MQFAAADITQLATDIWGSVLGLEIEPAETAELGEDCLTGCIQIAGAWRGSVRLDVPRSFAHQIAATMFDLSLPKVSEDDMTDALAELTNMLGGNIKSVLPGPSCLALPTVTEGLDYQVSIPGTRCLSDLAYSSSGTPIRIQLLEHDDVGEKRATSSQVGVAR